MICLGGRSFGSCSAWGTNDLSEGRVCLGRPGVGNHSTRFYSSVSHLLVTATSKSNHYVKKLKVPLSGKISCQRICNTLWWVFKILKTSYAKLSEAGTVLLKVFLFKKKDSTYFNINRHSHNDSRFKVWLILLKSLSFFIWKLLGKK